MKKLSFIISFVILFMTCFTENVFSNEKNNIPVSLSSQSNDNNNRRPDKGNRMPASSLSCIVNFESGQIEIATLPSIISYELWDEEGETQIAAYPSDSELVEFMSAQQGVYQIRLVTDEFIYVGYIEL